MQDFEKLGAFYLGRPYDLEAGSEREGLVLYDSRDLVTHAVIIGMTGSGKTGLGIDLLEEAAIDGVPAIAIDPKGDLGNLLLTFPRLEPGDFLPWINHDEAARKGMTPEAYAADQAALWRRGLESWGQQPERIERLRQAVDLAIYTPGSSAGLPISILRSFAAPPPEIATDHELLAERIGTTVSGLLNLLGLDADPVRSRDHILLSTILGHAWKAGRDLDVAGLIAAVQTPPVARVGVLDVESFYPAKDRFELAMRLNGLVAAPSFAAWLEGDPLDIDRLLFTPAGKPRLSIISIAHLTANERMFFVALLLNEVLGWMRRQSGTTSLRAVLYMDEVAGYMPPVANPPSKPALLTLLKQARAYGVGVVLATQNPVDLDYKGLSNTGTWLLGRLQTEQDKARLLDGLEGALAGSQAFDGARVSQMLSALGKRVFLLHNVHEDAPEVFETRWAMSYLRGPLTRDQIRTLMAPLKAARQAPAAGTTAAGAAATERPRPASMPGTTGTSPAAAGQPRPILPPGIPEYFAPSPGGGAVAHYEPRLWARAQVEITDRKLDVREARGITLLAPFTQGPLGVDWDRGDRTDLTLEALVTDPGPGATFDEPPPMAAQARSYAGWTRDFGRWLYETQQLELQRDPSSGLVSRPEEDERQFRIRLQVAYREQRDAARTRLQQKYAPKLAALQEKVRRAEAAVQREQAQASEQKMQSMFSVGASVLGALLGRKVVSATTVGRAATAARGMGRARKEADDVRRAEETVEQTRQRLTELEAELTAEIGSIDAGIDATTTPLEKVLVRPRKTQIAVDPVVLVWTPVA